MGKWIDRFSLLSLVAAALYLLFLQAFGSIFTACSLSFLCCTLLIRAFHDRSRKYRMTRLQAEAILQKWAYGPDDEAAHEIARLLGIAEDSSRLVYLPRHPTASISMGDVFGAWKSHRSEESIVIAAPCPADGRAKTFAKTLRSPAISIADASQLVPKLRRSNLTPPRTPQGKRLIQKIKEAFAALPGRRPWHKNLMIGLMLMLLYLITGSAAYLALSIGALFLSGIGLRTRA